MACKDCHTHSSLGSLDMVSSTVSALQIKGHNKNKNITKIQCDVCKRMVYPYYMDVHKTKKTCKASDHIVIYQRNNE